MNDKPANEFWVDLLDPSSGEIERVSRECGLEVPTREALQEVESSSRLRCDGQALYLSMPLAVPDSATALPVPLGFILSPKVLITIRFAQVKALEQVKARFLAEPPHDSAAVFAAIVEAIVDIGADMLEGVSANLAGMSTRIFRGPEENLHPHDKRFAGKLRKSLQEVGLVGDHLSHLRECLLGLQRIVGFTTERAIGGLAPDIATRLRTAQQDLDSLTNFEAHLTSKTQFLLDAILGFINTEQNDIFKLLTIVSVAGIPPTLIASMYGMNFHYMPELGWRLGYPWAIGLIVVSALVPMLWFKRRGWW